MTDLLLSAVNGPYSLLASPNNGRRRNPVITFTSQGGSTSTSSQTLTGHVAAARPGGIVTIYDNDNPAPIGSATVNADGTFFADITLTLGSNRLVAVYLDRAGRTAISQPLVETLTPFLTPPSHDSAADRPAPAVAVSAPVAFDGQGRALMTGTASAAAGLASVTLYDGSAKLGTAALGADGSWSLTRQLAAGRHRISAMATDAAGQSTTAGAPFILTTGIRNAPYAALEQDLDAQGQVTGDVYTAADGSLYRQDRITTLGDGRTLVDTFAGSYFDALPFTRQTDLFAADGTLAIETRTNRDGTHTVTGAADGQTLLARGNDTMTGGGANETFVFSANPGHEVITDFAVAGPGHDSLSLPLAAFRSIADVLHNATTSGQDTIISFGAASTLTLVGVTADALAAHPGDIKLHA